MPRKQKTELREQREGGRSLESLSFPSWYYCTAQLKTERRGSRKRGQTYGQLGFQTVFSSNRNQFNHNLTVEGYG